MCVGIVMKYLLSVDRKNCIEVTDESRLLCHGVGEQQANCDRTDGVSAERNERKAEGCADLAFG